MPISLKVLPLDYTTWRSRIINASKSFSFFAQLLFKSVFLKERKKKALQSLAQAWESFMLGCREKQGKII